MLHVSNYGYQPAPAQPVYVAQPPRNPSDSVGSWMLTIFVLGIPLVGFIYLLVVAFGASASESKQNFARATLIWYLIGIAISIIIMLIMAASGVALFNWLESTSSTNLR